MKFDNQGVQEIFIKYRSISNQYRFYDPKARQENIKHDIIFYEYIP